jgi:pimeloyl-ACP methyl ester carboxylesterase
MAQRIELTESFHHRTSTHTFTIAWRALGSPTSPPLIFIHGTPWSSQVWTPYALALSHKYHVYVFDNPGFGASPLEVPIPGEFQPKDKVEELDADLARQSSVFAALSKHWEESEEQGWKGRRPHVIAHDHAGLMSLRAYLLHGCRYASLCLVDVVAIGPFGQSLFDVVKHKPSYFLQLPDMAFEGILESYIRQAASSELGTETMEMLKAPWLKPGGKEGFVRQLCQAGYRSTDEVEGRYGEVGAGVPVKVIWGKEDRWIGVETAARLGEKIGAKEVVVVEGAGHLVMYDQGAQLGVELGVWLSEWERSLD